jgi:hypothetical protein
MDAKDNNKGEHTDRPRDNSIGSFEALAAVFVCLFFVLVGVNFFLWPEPKEWAKANGLRAFILDLVLLATILSPIAAILFGIAANRRYRRRQ